MNKWKRQAILPICLLVACFALPLLMGAFDKDKPAASTSLRASNPEMLANQSQLQTAINNEHIFSGTSAGTQTGDHTQGSARCFPQAGAPATRIDGAGFLSTDLGSLWVDTDDNALYILTATVPTWTPVSTEVIATMLTLANTFQAITRFDDLILQDPGFYVSTNTVRAADVNGLTLENDAGGVAIKVLDNAKVDSSASTAISNSTTLTEDDDDLLVSQKAVKAYIDSLGGSGRGFVKAWVSFNGNSLAINGTGFNVASVTRPLGGAGRYTITFSSAFSDDDYAVSGFTADIANGAGVVCNISSDTPLATGTALIETVRADNDSFADFDLVTIMIIGD